ncbi:hypothetical protein ACWCQ0_46860, partial [Streptomyces massasporeus]
MGGRVLVEGQVELRGRHAVRLEDLVVAAAAPGQRERSARDRHDHHTGGDDGTAPAPLLRPATVPERRARAVPAGRGGAGRGPGHGGPGVEDLHWADASTRHLLTYLLRTLRRGRIVVVASYRADDIHRRHPLRPLLAELDRLRTIRRIELARFTRTEVHRQLTGILAAEPDPGLVEEVFERSDGNAFFVEELIVSHEAGCAAGQLSDSLRDLLLVRVETLPEDAQRVARIVAEAGSPVEYGLLAAVARLAEDDLIEALRAAVGANLLLAVPDGDGY